MEIKMNGKQYISVLKRLKKKKEEKFEKERRFQKKKEMRLEMAKRSPNCV